MKQRLPYFEVPTPSRLRTLRVVLIILTVLCLSFCACAVAIQYKGYNGAALLLAGLMLLCNLIALTTWPTKKEFRQSREHWARPRTDSKVTIWLKDQIN